MTRPPRWVWRSKVPQQIDPEINQEKRECDKEESGYRVLGGGADAAVILDPVAGFNAEALFVMRMQLLLCHLDSMNDVEGVLNAMLALEAFVVVTLRPASDR